MNELCAKAAAKGLIFAVKYVVMEKCCAADAPVNDITSPSKAGIVSRLLWGVPVAAISVVQAKTWIPRFNPD